MKEHNPLQSAANERDLLISRLIDASSEGLAPDHPRVQEAWAALRVLAEHDVTLWQNFATAQYQHAALKGEVDRELSIVHRVDLPIPGERVARNAHEHSAERSRNGRPWTLALGGGGWLAAAALALMWFVLPSIETRVQDDSSQRTSAIAGQHVQTADEAITAYLALGGKDGRVIGEVPDRSVIQWRRRPGDGKIEAIVQRSFLERDILDDVYTVGRDELGRSVAMPVSYSSPGGGTSSSGRIK